MSDAKAEIGILGAGSFGTALLKVFLSHGRKVYIWARSLEVINSLNTKGFNCKYFPEENLKGDLKATDRIEDLNSCNLIFVCIPAASLDQLDWNEIAKEVLLVVTTKGLLKPPYFLPYTYFKAQGFKNVLVLSGPNFASDLIKLQPMASVLASEDMAAFELSKSFKIDCLRIYPSTDPLGVQVCGFYKNVIAVGTGFCAGLGFGKSSLFALLSRAAVELSRILTDLNCDPNTAFGLAGVGDLFLTGSNSDSRNFQFGQLLAQGYTAEQALKLINQTVEGFNSIRYINEFLAELRTDTPLLNAVNRIIQGETPSSVIASLFKRPIKTEL
jgi:glycerol-3-phosphate dehydrogenase (NAD(P)+)